MKKIIILVVSIFILFLNVSSALAIQYKCVCPSDDPKNPTKTICKYYNDISSTKMPKSCEFTGISSCKGIAPQPGINCDAVLSGQHPTSTDHLLTMTKTLNPAQFSNPESLAGRVIKLGLQFVGVITLALFIYGGVLFMVSGGNSEQKGKAIKVMVWAALGVVVIAGSYMFVNFLFQRIIV